jgi:hypothetical protein
VSWIKREMSQPGHRMTVWCKCERRGDRVVILTKIECDPIDAIWAVSQLHTQLQATESAEMAGAAGELMSQALASLREGDGPASEPKPDRGAN